MPKHERYTLDSEEQNHRTYEGEERAALVIDWLNGDRENRNSKPSRKRIEDLLECLRETITLAESVSPDFNWPNAQYRKSGVPDGFDELTTELYHRLREYVTYPAFTPAVWGKEWEIEDGVCGKRPPGESVAAHGIIDLAKRGLLDRVHRCDCGRWYFARFTHQRSCSAACRRNVYEKTEKFKAKRRKYMRKYYRLKTSGKVK